MEIIVTKQHWWDAPSFFTIHINLHVLCIELHVEIQWLMNSLRKIMRRFCSESFIFTKNLVFHSQANLCTRCLSMHRDISISSWSVNWSGYVWYISVSWWNFHWFLVKQILWKCKKSVKSLDLKRHPMVLSILKWTSVQVAEVNSLKAFWYTLLVLQCSTQSARA